MDDVDLVDFSPTLFLPKLLFPLSAARVRPRPVARRRPPPHISALATPKRSSFRFPSPGSHSMNICRTLYTSFSALEFIFVLHCAGRGRVCHTATRLRVRPVLFLSVGAWS